MKFKLVIVCLSLLNLFHFLSAGEVNFLSDADKDRLRNVVQLKEPLSSNDLSSVYHYVNLNLLLDKTLPDASKICAHIQSETSDSLESIYYITSIAKLIGTCQINANKFIPKLNDYINDKSSVEELYRTGLSLVNLGKPLDSTKFSKLLLSSIKRDETLLNTGLAFQLASKFTKPEDRNVFVNKIGDVVVQADEVNENLQFEGGLGVSSAIINGIYQLATAANKPTGINNDQALKFVNYFLSRKYVLLSKGASDVIETLSLFANNKYHIPFIVTKYGSSALHVDNPVLTIKVTNVLGLSVGPLSVTGVSLTKKGETTPVLQNIKFEPVTGDSRLFASNLLQKPLNFGFYNLVINAVPQKADSRIFGNTGVVIQTSVLTQLGISNVELTVFDSEIGNKNLKLEYPSELSQVLDVDYSQRLQLKFQLMDRVSGSNFQVHQAFLRFYHEQSKQEIIFIIELDSASNYKVDLNLQIRSKDFNYLSGVYNVNLIIGDALVLNSLNWKIGTFNIQFGQQGIASQSVSEYSVKPEIKHIFREQEKRPHVLVSNFFTFLVMVPFVFLFIMWYKIGINFSGFKLSLSAILFHTGLALVFLLYGCFFVQLNMFQTVKYLAAISVLIYLSGHSLLSGLIKKGK